MRAHSKGSSDGAAFASDAPVTCPACTSLQARVELEWRSGYRIARCSDCESLFSSPMPSPEALDAYYQGFLYRKPMPGEVARRVRQRRRELESLFDLRGRGAEGVRFLDHGGGTGGAFGAARDLGMEAYYADIDQDARAFVADNFGLDAAHFVSDLGAVGERFDLVLSDNVIEHVVDPAALLASLSASLAPGGTLVVKTPSAAASEHYFYPMTLRGYLSTAWQHNRASAVLRMAVSRPIWYCDPPRHLYSFTERGLARLAERALPEGMDYRVETFGTPLFGNTVTATVLRRPRGVKSAISRALAAPLIPLELGAKAVQLASLRLGVVTPGGLTLRVRRPQGMSAMSARSSPK